MLDMCKRLTINLFDFDAVLIHQQDNIEDILRPHALESYLFIVCSMA